MEYVVSNGEDFGEMAVVGDTPNEGPDAVTSSTPASILIHTTVIRMPDPRSRAEAQERERNF